MALPDTNATRYPDEYIEHWGAIFTRHRLDRVLGITFERFVRLPGHFMNRYHALLNSAAHRQFVGLQEAPGDFEPLLAAQAEVAERIYRREIDAAIARCAQGTSTHADAELLERCIAAARGISHLPRQDNGHPVEKMRHHCHPKSRAMFPEEGKS